MAPVVVLTEVEPEVAGAITAVVAGTSDAPAPAESLASTAIAPVEVSSLVVAPSGRAVGGFSTTAEIVTVTFA